MEGRDQDLLVQNAWRHLSQCGVAHVAKGQAPVWLECGREGTVAGLRASDVEVQVWRHALLTFMIHEVGQGREVLLASSALKLILFNA